MRRSRVLPVFLVLAFSGPVAGQRLELFPPNPRKGDFVIFTVRGAEAHAVRVGKQVFRLAERSGDLRRGYGAIPLSTASTAKVVLLGRGNTVVAVTTQVFLPRDLPPPVAITVSQEYVSPPKEVLDRVAAEAELLKRVRTRTWTNRRWFHNRPVDPVRPGPGRLGSVFGEERVFSGVRRSVHWGQDIKGAPADILAVFPGRVVLASNLYYAGNTVFIHHGFGMLTQYSHLSNLAVRQGEWVEAGQVLGRMGMSGRATGPHLHFAAYVQGVAVDPLSILSNTRRWGEP